MICERAAIGARVFVVVRCEENMAAGFMSGDDVLNVF